MSDDPQTPAPAPEKPRTHDENGKLLPGAVLNPAGRPKGSKNKRTTAAQETADRLGINPLEVLLLLSANRYAELNPNLKQHQLYNKEGLPKSVPLEIRRAAATDAAKFLYPTLKALEVTGDNGGPIEHFLSMGEEGLAKRRAELAMALDEDV